MTKGFTLIELLVVITIMAIIGTFTVANFRTFGEDKELQNAALDIQSLLRTAQTNASSGVKCGSNPAENWFVEFTAPATINLKCNNIATPVKSLVLRNNIQLGTIENASPPVPPPACPKFKDATTTSQNCKNFSAGGITGDKYINCSDITVSNFNCEQVCGTWAQNINYYNSSTDMTPSNYNVLTAPWECTGSGSPVTLRLTGGSSGGSCTSPVKFNFAPLSGAFSSDCNNSSIMEVGVQNAKGAAKLVKVTAGNISIAEGVAVTPSPVPSPTPSPTPSPSPSPSPSSSPGGGTCPYFVKGSTQVLQQSCKNSTVLASGPLNGTYYIKCSELNNSRIFDCTSTCTAGHFFEVNYYPTSAGTGSLGWLSFYPTACPGPNTATYIVIP